MSWRSIVITKPAQLKVKNNSLHVIQDKCTCIPFEDIAVILLDHAEISLTHPVLGACSSRGICLFSTDRTHTPSGVFLPFLSHNYSTKYLLKQLKIPRPMRKRTWSQIVSRKLENQAACLEIKTQSKDERLASYARRVRSGDPENLEAQAAAYYFSKLFGKTFKRSADCLTNSSLNYGYAILRGAITRAVVAHGLMPSLGIWHSSIQNSFNLADDLIEPYRPVVDLFVATKTREGESEELKPQDKSALIDLLNQDIDMPRGRMTLLSSIEQVVESLVRVIDSRDEALLELPNLCNPNHPGEE